MKISPFPAFTPFYCHRKNGNFSQNNFSNHKLTLTQDIFFKGKGPSKKPGIYAINAQGKYKRFLSEEAIVNKLKVPRDKIRQCMDGEIDSFRGYTFIQSEEVETIKDGEIQIDEEFIKDLAQLVAENEGDKDAVYGVKRDGSYARYDSREDVAQKFDVNILTVRNWLNGVINIPKCGCVFLKAQDVEYIDENGQVAVNMEEIKEAVKRFEELAFYSIDSDLNYRKFYSTQEASKVFGIAQSEVSACVRGKNKTAKEIIFVSANKIEYEKTGRVRKDVVKYYASLIKKKPIEVLYAINMDECTKFDSRKKASEALDINLASISQCLNKRQNTAKGYYIIDANKLEIKNEDGSVSINQEKLAQIRKELHKNALYIVKTDGSYKRFNHQAEALKQKMLRIDSERHFQEIGGYYCIKASNVESFDENGKRVLDKEKLKEIFESKRQRSIYVFGQEGFVKKYNSFSTPYTEMHIPYKRIYKAKDGYKILKAVDVESKNEQGGYYLDYEKVNKLLGKAE